MPFDDMLQCLIPQMGSVALKAEIGFCYTEQF